MDTKQFIERAVSIHGDTYSYEKSVYVRPHQKLTITCPLHGDFDQSPSNHFAGKGCNHCGNHRIGRKLASNRDSFIEKAIEKHGARYSYDEVIYINARTHVTITCPVHGNFQQVPDSHLRGNGCPTCSFTSTANKKRLSKDEFVERSIAIHGNKYLYDLVDYVNNSTKVSIVCPEHGIFKQTPANHLIGRGCAKCVDIGSWNRFNADQFISDARAIHGNRYDYSQVIYQNNSTPVEIICPEHGSFFQMPVTHTKNKSLCPLCAIKNRATIRTKTTAQFIEDSRAIHGNRYDYSESVYISSQLPVTIICPTHGKFLQAPANHIAGNGCQICRQSRGEVVTRTVLESLSISYTAQARLPGCIYREQLSCDFFIDHLGKKIIIEYNGQQHYEPVAFFGGEVGFAVTQARDKAKIDYATSNGIPLIIIPYTVTYIKSFLLAELAACGI